MSDVIPAAGVLIVKDGNVLLVRHGEKASHVTGTYGFPAGRVEEGEKEKEAAVRELREETGLITSEDMLIEYPTNVFVGAIDRKDGTKQSFSLKIFVCKSFSGELKGSEEAMPEWVKITRLDEYNLLPNVKEIVLKEIQW